MQASKPIVTRENASGVLDNQMFLRATQAFLDVASPTQVSIGSSSD